MNEYKWLLPWCSTGLQFSEWLLVADEAATNEASAIGYATGGDVKPDVAVRADVADAKYVL